ncbi:MAG: recombinase family protein [Candidatus Peribacteraceae bacterium]|nr:recombinase family protein [Candidatus Peribacteraceae bacterium]
MSMKAADYCRKSQDSEDRQILSIDGQHDENVAMAQRNGDELVKTYSDSGTAKTPHKRSGYQAMIADIRAGKIEVLYCWKLNRLARNPIEGGEIQWLLQQGTLKAIVTPHKTYLQTDNVLQMAVELGMATQYSIDLSRDVKRGMRQKVKMGWRPGKAAVGYINDYAGLKGEKKILVDEERFELVRRCWDALLTRAYTVPQILKMANEDWGLTVRAGRGGRETRPMGLTTLYEIFTNPFYYGEYDWGGETYNGKHRPMITQEEFEKAQSILGKKGKPRQRKYLNPYAGLIQCGECGAMIVVNLIEKEIKSTGEMKTYRYYRCGHNRKTVKCSQKKAMSEQPLEMQLTAFVASADIPQAFIEWCLEKLKLSQEDRMKQHKSVWEKHQGGYTETVEKIDTLVDRQLSESTRLPEEIFNEKLKKLRAEQKRLKNLVDDFDVSAKQWTDDIVDELNFTLKLKERFAEEGREKRLEILHRIGQVIQLKDGELDFRIREPYHSFIECMKETESILGDIQPIRKPLSAVNSSVIQQVEQCWSGRAESNRRL